MEFTIDLSHETIENITAEKLGGLHLKDVDEENFYDKLCLDTLQEHDELSGVETGFMEGYLDA